MQRTETQSKSTGKHGAQFMAARDSRNRKVPGISTRNGRFHGQLWMEREDGTKTASKFPLATEDATPVGHDRALSRSVQSMVTL